MANTPAARAIDFHHHDEKFTCQPSVFPVTTDHSPHSHLLMKKLLLLSLLSISIASSTLAAESLGDLARSSGQDWVAGKWVSSDGAASLTYEWILDRHAVSMSFKMGSRESSGLLTHTPGTETVNFTAADNAGGITTGVWSEEGGNLVLKLKHTEAEGKVINMALEHIKTDADTMTVKVYEITASGALESSPKLEMIYKRQK